MSGYKTFALAGAGHFGRIIIDELNKLKTAGKIEPIKVLLREVCLPAPNLSLSPLITPIQLRTGLQRQHAPQRPSPHRVLRRPLNAHHRAARRGRAHLRAQRWRARPTDRARRRSEGGGREALCALRVWREYGGRGRERACCAEQARGADARK